MNLYVYQVSVRWYDYVIGCEGSYRNFGGLAAPSEQEARDILHRYYEDIAPNRAVLLEREVKVGPVAMRFTGTDGIQYEIEVRPTVQQAEMLLPAS